MLWFKSLLHDQVFFDKFHVSNFFDRVNEELLTILSKNANLSVEKTFDIELRQRKFGRVKRGFIMDKMGYIDWLNLLSNCLYSFTCARMLHVLHQRQTLVECDIQTCTIQYRSINSFFV